MVRFALAFLGGIGLIEWAPQLPVPAALVLVLLLAVALAALVRRLWPLAFAAGMVLAVGQAQSIVAERWPASLDGTEVLVTGVITGVPERDADRLQFDLVPDAAPDEQQRQRLPQRLRISWYQTEQLPLPGERWRLQLKLRSPRGLINPGGYDYELKLAREQIGATGYVRPEPMPQRLAGSENRQWLARARMKIAESIAAACHECDNPGVLQALAVGLQRQVPDRQWRLFAATGITHLVAISGLHVTLFALLAAAGLRAGLRILKHPRARLNSEAVVGAVAAGCYALLAGLSIPTLRTLLMLALWAVALLWRRALAPFDLLALTLVIVLLHDPLAVTSPGCLLSFGAVAAILAVMSGRPRRPGALQSFVWTQSAVTIGLIPLLLVSVGNFTWLSPVANAVAIPLFTLIVVPAVLLGAALALVTPAASWPLFVADRLLSWLFVFLEWLQRLPGAAWTPAAITGSALLVAVIAVGVALSAWPLTVRALAAAALAMLLTYVPARPLPGDWRLVLLDVGQGLSAVLETRTHVLVFDTGPGYRSGQSAGGRVVVPYLQSRGWHAIDQLILSHDDLDHTGGGADLLRSFPDTPVLAGQHIAAPACRAGQQWVWDQVHFEVLHPATDTDLSDNDGSCVVSIVGANARVVLVADIGGAIETALAARHALASDVALVAHHGSQSSSSATWIAALQARWALVSAARGNRWNFPRPEVVARWHEHDAQVLNTGDLGALTVDSATARTAVPLSARQRQRHWWRSA